MSTREQMLKQAIQENLQAFNGGSLTACGLALFQTLGYRVDKRSESDDSPDTFLTDFNGEGLLNLEKALVGDWDAIDLLFQLTKDEIIGGDQMRIGFGNNNRVDNTVIESYLFFAVRLNGSSLQKRGIERYSRKDLATITREVNKLFPMPVMLLFQHEQTLTLSVINRRLNKRDELRDVLEKVTLIKDIAVASPHQAHIEILFDLSLEQLYKAHKFSNFVELHRAWQKTLDSSELHKRFFKEVADWYFWATRQVVFPADAPKDEEGQDSISVIRMITRLIFVWFLKEKGLVPEELFDRSHIENLIDFDDPNSSSYYKAILQNLFFATLNQPMNRDKPGSRKFRSEGKGNSRDGHYMIHNVYRYHALMKQPDAVEQLLAEVPFLNGGLFECLDQTTDHKRPIRIDGFSDRADNALSVPNALFFASEQDIDLNDSYGTKNKRYKVCGLIDILNRYKFTITENTPIEEEIALDPELLGKVFENLLASYNQETRVTARKQTGSFYTPREVVDYMVDESLMVYLATQLLEPELVDDADRGELEQRLRILLNYGNAENPFADRSEERLLLIVAIDQLKMLDPAVGSGAFPMGILQKLVFILGKLDPDNELWKYQQKERVRQDIQQAQKISYEEAREAAIAQLEERLKEIEDDFENNEMDYPRKLFLIENCIYGVDIQPIAVQIAKLRFFISLLVEQKVIENSPNRGVLPLPNLETKFVAANTLMGIDRPDQFGQTQILIRPHIEQIEGELKSNRHKIFTARTPQTKEKYRDRDQALRTELAELLKTEGLSGETAKQLSQWNPYDQNASTDFFDPEWMFGAKEGFDVVIGNPPYIDSEVMTKDQPELRQRYCSVFESAKGNWDLFILFIEKGIQLQRSNGCISYIVPNKLIGAKYSESIRAILSRYSMVEIRDYSEVHVFKDVDVYPIVFSLMKTEIKSNVSMTVMNDIKTVSTRNIILPSLFYNDIHWGRYFVDKTALSVVLKCLSFPPLIKLFPLITGAATVSEAYKIKELIYEYDGKSEGNFRKLINTGTIDKYTSLWGKRSIKYLKGSYKTPIIFDSDLRQLNPNRLIQASSKKIIIGGMTKVLECFYDEGEYLAGKSTTIILDSKRKEIKYVLAVLNSKLISFWYRIYYKPLTLAGGYLQVDNNKIKTVPMPDASHEQTSLITELVDQIQEDKKAENNVDTQALEQEVDKLLYQIYGLTGEEVKVVEAFMLADQ